MPLSESHLKTVNELRTEARTHLQACRQVAESVLAQHRDFTDHERVEAFKHRDIAQEKLKIADAIVQRSKTADQLAGELQSIAEGVPNGSYHPAAGVKRHAAREWGAAVVGQCSDGYRFKGITPSGSVVVGMPAPAVVEEGRPVTTLRSLVPSEPTQGRFSYFRQLARANNASVVAPGARKPTTPYATTLVEDRARVVAHISEPMSRMDLADAPRLSDWVSQELAYGVARALETEMIIGDGTGEHMVGLANTSGIQTQAFATSPVITCRKAVTRLEALGYAGTGWIMAPSDFESIELAATSSGSLLVTEAGARAPIETAARRLWGVPVVVSPGCPQGTAYFADFGLTRLYVREEVRIDWSENIYSPDQFGAGVGGSLFEANEIAFRAEGRFGWAVLRPDAVVEISLTA